MARVGVFVCWCGANIAGTVDVKRVAEEASKLPGVVYSTDYKYMCSDPGQEIVRDAIKEHKLNSVVIAACSPRMHEPTFRACVADVGLNPYKLEMANIRGIKLRKIKYKIESLDVPEGDYGCAVAALVYLF